MLDARIEATRGALVVRVVGHALDSGCARELRRMADALARGRALVVLSLEHVDEVDCSGLAGLVVVLKRLAPGGEVRLARAGAAVRELLAETRLDELFPVFEDVPSALSGSETPELEEAVPL